MSSNTCKVVIESSSRSIMNLLNFGANKGNVSDLSDYINNEVYKLTQPGEIPMRDKRFLDVGAQNNDSLKSY